MPYKKASHTIAALSLPHQHRCKAAYQCYRYCSWLHIYILVYVDLLSACFMIIGRKQSKMQVRLFLYFCEKILSHFYLRTCRLLGRFFYFNHQQAFFYWNTAWLSIQGTFTISFGMFWMCFGEFSRDNRECGFDGKMIIYCKINFFCNLWHHMCFKHCPTKDPVPTAYVMQMQYRFMTRIRVFWFTHKAECSNRWLTEVQLIKYHVFMLSSP